MPPNLLAEARAHFRAKGALTDCPNPRHAFRIGRLMGYWRWARDSWELLAADGELHRFSLHLGSVETTDGIRARLLIVGKLYVIFGMASR